MTRENTSTENHRIGADETVIADANRRAGLAAVFKIDRVRQYLRLKTGQCGKAADLNPMRAVDQMTMSDCGVFFNNKLWAAAGLMNEVLRMTWRKARNPIAASDRRV